MASTVHKRPRQCKEEEEKEEEEEEEMRALHRERWWALQHTKDLERQMDEDILEAEQQKQNLADYLARGGLLSKDNDDLSKDNDDLPNGLVPVPTLRPTASNQ